MKNLIKYKTSVEYISFNTYIDNIKDFCYIYNIDYYNVIWAFYLYQTRFERLIKTGEKEDIYGHEIINYYINNSEVDFIDKKENNYFNRFQIAAFIISVVVSNCRLSKNTNVYYNKNDRNEEYVNANNYKEYICNLNKDAYICKDEVHNEYILNNKYTNLSELDKYINTYNDLNNYYQYLKNLKNIYNIKKKIYNKIKDKKIVENCLKRLDYLLMANIISKDFNQLEFINLINNENINCYDIFEILRLKINNYTDFDKEIKYDINNDIVNTTNSGKKSELIRLEKGETAVNFNGDIILSNREPNKKDINELREITHNLHIKRYLTGKEYDYINNYFNIIF